ncbi:CDK-activating kinase assembly factor [Wallemia mellicola]|nr:CDK-activating kinase assembly factor [Wallemia mellicola]
MEMSGMDMGGMDMGDGGMDMNMSCSSSMLWNWNIMNICPVSDQWHIKSHGAFAGTVIGVFFIVVAVETVRRFGREYDRKIVNDYRKSQADAGNVAPDVDAKGDIGPAPVLVGTGQLKPFRPTFTQQLIRSLVYFIQFSATYIVMLIAMTFNGYLLFAIFFGGGFGYLDQAVAGFGAGVVATFTMQPFDILKVRFQVATRSERVGYGRAIYSALKNVVKKEGPSGLWRGIVPNIIGNSSGWATYFYFYTTFKDVVHSQQRNNASITPSQYLLCASTAGSISAMVTNPFYVIKTRMYTSSYKNNDAYRGLFDGLSKIVRSEGVLGLWKGTLLALGTVVNSALQFTIYEEMKKTRFAVRGSQPCANDKLPNWEYTALSGSSKLLALATTYPYQVVRSRLQCPPMWLNSNKSNRKGSKPSTRDSTPLEAGKTTKLLGPGVRDKTGKITEFSVGTIANCSQTHNFIQSADDKCPVCSSDRYLNPSLRLLVSPCYHKMCESCIDRLFTLGPEPCPICGKITRKTAFVAQTFEDLGVEKEVAVRRRVAKAYNLTSDDFSDLRSYNDYLEEVEDIAYNLINNIDIPNTEAKIRSHQAKHASSIISNSAKEIAEAEAVKAEEEREKKEREARAKEARRELEQEMFEKDQDKEVLLRELEHSSKSAERVMAQQRSKALKRSSARTTNQNKPLSLPANAFPPDNPMPFTTEDVWDPLYDEDTYDDYSNLYKIVPNVYADGFKGAETVVGGDDIAKAGGWTRNQAWERAIREGVSEWAL